MAAVLGLMVVFVEWYSRVEFLVHCSQQDDV